VSFQHIAFAAHKQHLSANQTITAAAGKGVCCGLGGLAATVGVQGTSKCCHWEVDASGKCCQSINACGVCNGAPAFLDGDNVCCYGVRTADNKCCDGELDRCGVCNGDNSGCGYSAKLAFDTTGLLTGDEQRALCDEVKTRLKDYTADVLDDESIACTVCTWILFVSDPAFRSQLCLLMLLL
jgi:hypothetical protein